MSYVERSPVHVARRPGRQRATAGRGAPRVRRRCTASSTTACRPSGEGAKGISHALMAERYALPGELIVGTDSHTPHSGALGCVAFGVGTTDMANAFMTGAVRFADARGAAHRGRPARCRPA